MKKEDREVHETLEDVSYKDQFFMKLIQLASDRDFEVDIYYKYRKGFSVLSVYIEYMKCNFKMRDYFGLHSEDDKPSGIPDSDFAEAIDDVDSFIYKTEKLND